MGDGKFGDGRRFGEGKFGDGTFGDGTFGDGTFGDGTFGDGTFGDGRFGDGTFGAGIIDGGFGISFGRLGRAGGIGAILGGTLRRFSKEWNTSFLVKSHSTWYDVYPAQETTLAQFTKKD
ncbi:hypothetical protein AN963_04485 [Brevibacillus choshinensis]|uniref:Uncharacterized protein n=1 Tax=Brevibacillus choshinensis TaxID=54911 RepID=A0ABR5NBX3_BRECH|nr:hypothetical protein [Brevibacillus choshinensis]KQL49040.1 hypothetical protein AN963_04485 [Brevibacillus choshinensis]